MPRTFSHRPVEEWISEFERAIRRDPARRGLIGSEEVFGPVCPGELAQAAMHLEAHARSVAIVTGFYIPAGDPPAAETDGPPGALVLAQALQHMGVETQIITDGFCFSAVRAAASGSGYPPERVVRYPHPVANGGADSAESTRWLDDFWRSDRGRGLTHLIAIERVGPSHTPESLAAQQRPGPPPVESFLQKVPECHRNACHNMRGMIIDEYSGDLHRLFEEAVRKNPAIKTIGIGDGANEIGMGVAAWEDLERRLTGDHAGWIPCRIATDWNIVAGTSNWGGYALAAAVALLRGDLAAIAPFDAAHQLRVLEAMIANGPAVDGVTRRREATVDGLLFLTYIQAWEAIRTKLKLPE
ncbi:MAG: DUF4392 domain-containing protein [Planctomycetes bacterium]|nr:DUF4392 domain-containing protein [Planctomycetota bacterium]